MDAVLYRDIGEHGPLGGLFFFSTVRKLSLPSGTQMCRPRLAELRLNLPRDSAVAPLSNPRDPTGNLRAVRSVLTAESSLQGGLFVPQHKEMGYEKKS